MDAAIIRSFQKELYAEHVSLAVGRPWSCTPKWQYGDIVDLIALPVYNLVSA